MTAERCDEPQTATAGVRGPTPPSAAVLVPMEELGPPVVAIVGSRTWADLERVRRFVHRLPPGTVVMSGGARGVDATAEQAARARGLHVTVFKPDWGRHGTRAGALRNKKIVEAADRVVAFWDGSRGTAITIDLAKRAGKPVEVIRP